MYELLFLLAMLAALSALVGAIALAIAGRRATSLRIVRGLVVSAAAYVGVGVVVSLLGPRRLYAVGEPWCFDDWCLTVERVTTSPALPGSIDEVDLQLTSRALRITQRARGAWIYLLDAEGRRYAPEAESSAVPLDTLLGPGESVAASRTFRLPAGVRAVGLVTGHGGGYCGAMSFLIIGSSGCLFHKPPMVRIP